jgi:cytochrome c peroxidase
MKHRLIKIISIGCALACVSATVINRFATTPLTPQYPAYFGNRIFIPDDNPLTEEGVYLGRMLFYETRLSVNNRISCATCHRQQYAFTDGKRFSTGVDGSLTDRNSMSLVNLLWIRNFFWDGRAAGLEKQAETPLTNPHEMGQALTISAQKLQNTTVYPSLFNKAFGSSVITGSMIVKALAQFERTLISANSKYDQYLRGQYKPTASELNGITLFFSNPDPANHIRGAACAHCHGGPKTFNELFHNNGLDSLPKDVGREKITGQAYDKGRFRVVTLRNIALTAPYMHDGRFKTLEEVLDQYNEHIQPSATLSIFLQNNSNTLNGSTLGLTAQEKTDIIAFLHLLTDSSFITDKHFSIPFLNK